jgi:hypothetical protein
MLAIFIFIFLSPPTNTLGKETNNIRGGDANRVAVRRQLSAVVARPCWLSCSCVRLGWVVVESEVKVVVG